MIIGDATSWTDTGAALAVAASVAWGFFERAKKERAETAKRTAEDAHKIIEVKDELIKVQTERATAWRDKYESEHVEYVAYRSECHTRLNEASALVLRYTAENAELRAKTDLSPILAHQEQQNECFVKILETLNKINTTQDLLAKSIMSSTSANLLAREAK